MKVQDIQVGHSYSDGNQGLRKVMAIEGSPLRVRYEILAAKIEREMGHDFMYVSVLGQERQCDLESFARWAKSGYEREEAKRVLLGLQAAKVKLSPGEDLFLEGVLKETGWRPLDAGAHVTYDHTEGRAVSGLEKKGLLRRVGGSEVEVLPLGSARMAAMVAI